MALVHAGEPALATPPLSCQERGKLRSSAG
jgi:hypothetical protein